MITDKELSDAMRTLESDSPAEADVAATVRARINRDHKFRNTALASLAAVAAVAAIVITASFLRSPAQPSQIQPVSPPQSQASSAPLIVPAPQTAPTRSPATTTPQASSGPETTPPTTTNNPAVTGFSARCYTTADLNRTDNHLAISLDVPIGPQAMELCQQNWAEGTLFATPPFIRDQPAGPGQSVPTLVACVLGADISDEGTEEVAIIPGTDDTCTQLNLPRYTG